MKANAILDSQEAENENHAKAEDTTNYWLNLIIPMATGDIE